MNLAAIIAGISAALLVPVMIVVATAAGALLNLIQLLPTRARTTRKPIATPAAHSRKDSAEVVKLPEGRGDVDKFRPAA